MMKATYSAVLALALVVMAPYSSASTPDVSPVERDYGPLLLPADAPPEAAAAWLACRPADQEVARRSLATGVGEITSRNYVPAVGTLDALAGLQCFVALLRAMGVSAMEIQSVYAHDGLRRREVPAGSGRYVEEEGPVGHYVAWAQRPDGCRVTIWGVLGPPREGTPWYAERAPSAATACPAAEAGP